LQLLSEIGAEKENKTIVFVETKRKVDEITRSIQRDGWNASGIHGDKSQNDRDWVLAGRYRLFLVVSLRLNLLFVCFRFQKRKDKHSRSNRRGRPWTW
jgi:Helicase conserved C-terminal domain